MKQGISLELTENKTRIWHVKMPDLRQAIVSPDLLWLANEETDLNNYLKDPTHPVMCVLGHQGTMR